MSAIEQSGRELLSDFQRSTYYDWNESSFRKIALLDREFSEEFQKIGRISVWFEGMNEIAEQRDRLISQLRSIKAWIEAVELSIDLHAEPDKNPPESVGDRVFLVHGWNKLALRETESYLRSLGLEPIVLQDEPNLGRTLIEKFEQCSDVDYAIIIMTADDFGCGSDVDLNDPSALKRRARQNVILELGFFIGALGRKKIAVLFESNIEKPSDIEGVAYIPYDPSEGWKFKLGRELKAAGLSRN